MPTKKNRYYVGGGFNIERFEFATLEEAISKAQTLVEQWHFYAFIVDRKTHKQYKVEECRGEAHENPFIDNCQLCAHHWGVIVTKGE